MVRAYRFDLPYELNITNATLQPVPPVRRCPPQESAMLKPESVAPDNVFHHNQNITP